MRLANEPVSIITRVCARGRSPEHPSPLCCNRTPMRAGAITPELLGNLLQQFLADTPHAVVIEDGAELCDFRSARYSVAGEGKCVLHIWSEERNLVRRVLDAKGGNG